jgi:hypothetical protein
MKLKDQQMVYGYLNVVTGNGVCKPCLSRNLHKGEFSQEFVDSNLIELSKQEAGKFDCIFCGRNLRLALEQEG